MILEVLLDFFPVVVYKNLGVSQAFAKEGLKLILRDRDRAIYILFLLKLLLLEADPVREKRCNKKNLVSLLSSSGGKMVLKLLTKVITFYVGLSAVHVYNTGF